MKHLSIDIETRSGADITKTGSYRYAQDPDFQILLFAYKIDYEDVQIIDFTSGEALPEEIRAALEDPAVIKHAYNAAFEWYCLNRAGTHTPIEQWRCTMFHAMYCAMPAGLAATGTAIGLPEDKKKLSVGRALIKYFCTPQKETKKFHKKYHDPKDDPGRWSLFKTYCKQDVTAEFEILQRLKAFPVPELEEIRWQRDILRNANGVRVDRQLIRGALSISAETSERLSKRAKALTGLDNPNSPAQLKQWITDRTGREITALRKEDVTRMLAGDIPEDVREVLHIRQQAGKTSVKKYDAMRDTIGEGDRIRGLLQFYGAPRTGRWCLTGDHEVLTPDGWVRLDSYKGGQILCWNSKTEQLSFQQSKAVSFPYDGKMITYDGQRIAQIATPDHKMPVLTKEGLWEPSTVEKIGKKRVTIPFTGKRTVQSRPYDIKQLKVLIMTQADGHYTADGALRFHFSKERKIERCKILLTDCGIPYVVQHNTDKTVTITIKPVHLPIWLRMFSKKIFGYWMLDEPLEVVFEELALWDGYAVSANSMQYSTTVRENADVIQACALCAGYSASMIAKKRKEANWSEAYCVNIWFTPGHGTCIRREQIDEIDFKGTVYCAVTKTGYFAVRRNGKIWITGNSGRLVQFQNLPRNYLSTLDVARKITRQGNGAGLELIYGNVPDTLAQLIRTAFIPSEGRHFVVTDFSAIEARVIAWLAGEKWVQQVFADGGDIYCATASQMFGVPVEKHGINGDLRQKGKVATLALGYNGGPGALIQMGALDMGLREDELPDIVRRWRLANPHICKLWRDMEQAAIHTVQTAEDTCVRGITFRLEGDLIYGLTFLTMQLPSGRKLHYQDPVIKEGKFGNPALSYMGQTNHAWVRTDTYGGRLVENCVAKGTQVLTDHGWKSIEQITALDLVYDGVEFVKHAGVVYQGRKRVNWVNGIYMTPEHKILTSKGWQENGKSNGSYWADISLPYGVKAGRKKQSGKATLVMPVRLRKSHGGSGRRFKEKELCNKIVRVHGEKTDIGSKYEARDVRDTDMECLALHERTVRSSYGAGVEELRWTGDNCLHKMERKLRKVLCRYGGLISQWFRTGSDRQRQRVQPGKLPLGTEKNKFKEQKDKCVYRYACRKNDNCRSFRNIRDRGHNSVLSSTSRMAERIVIHETKCKKPVYDIKNCGPRHSFIVKDFHEKPRCVHNCIQGIARDCLAEAVDRMEEKGWDIVMMIHDEVVIDAPPEVTLAEANAIMAEPIAWAPGLILKGDGFEGEYYRKE